MGRVLYEGVADNTIPDVIYIGKIRNTKNTEKIIQLRDIPKSKLEYPFYHYQAIYTSLAEHGHTLLYKDVSEHNIQDLAYHNARKYLPANFLTAGARSITLMTETCRFTDCTKEYLTKFYGILDNMIKGMEDAELTDSLSHNFIVQMIPHHRAAIEMSRNILQYTNCAPLQRIAQNIISMQTQSIQDMLNVKEQCSRLSNSRMDFCLYQRRFQQIVHTMFEGMDTAYADNNLSNTFMRQMIPHHMGAVRMSENALHYDICPGLQPILNDIITSQRRGICEMEQLLGDAYSPNTAL